MTADQTYKIILYATAKNSSQGYVSPEDFNNVLMPVAQNGYLDYLLGQYQRYMPGKNVAPVEFSGNERIRTSIAPLIYSTVLSIDNTGLSSYPSDFEEVDAMWSLYNTYRIRFTQQNNLWSVRNSVIDPISEEPIYSLNHYGFQFYPENLAAARMSYVRKVPPVIWGYTLDANDVPVYNPLTSQDPVWSDTDMFNVIVRALALIGVNITSQVVSQYAQVIKQQGQ